MDQVAFRSFSGNQGRRTPRPGGLFDQFWRSRDKNISELGPDSYLLDDSGQHLKQVEANQNIRQLLKKRRWTSPHDERLQAAAEYLPIKSSRTETSDVVSVRPPTYEQQPTGASDRKVEESWQMRSRPQSATGRGATSLPNRLSTTDSLASIPVWYRQIEDTGLDFFGVLHEEICDLINWLDPTPEETKQRQQVVARLQLVVQWLWPNCKVHPFGSYYTGLYLPHGDIDVCLIDDRGEDPKLKLKSLAKWLRKSRIAEETELILKARVPIINYIDRKTGIPVDISFNQDSSLTTSEFVREQLKRYVWLRPLVMALKLYLQQRRLGRTHKGGVGSYLLFVMVLSFLQQHKVSYCKSLQANTGLGHLLYDFFQLYGVDFCYEQTAISVKANGSYFPKQLRSWYYSDRPWELAVESPLDAGFDLGKSSYNIRIIRNCFRQSWMDLAELHRSWQQTSSPARPILRSVIFSGDPLFWRLKNTNGETGGAGDDEQQQKSLSISAVRPIPQLNPEIIASVEKSLPILRSKAR